VELVDLAPTLLALLDLEPASGMVGDDLRPLLVAEREGISGPVFASVRSRRMVLDWPLKGIFDAELGTAEVYDLSRDPRERQNLAGERPADRERLRGLLRGWPRR
jgi:arylsulfatase A-like enzyme